MPCCAEQSRIGGVVTRRILVTGASGFVAQALFSARGAGDEYFAASRTVLDIGGVQWRQSPTLSISADWKSVLEGIDIVVHLAARVHLPGDGDQSAYRVENCDGAVKLAQDAIEVGVRRFIFLSTSKVLGDESGEGPLDETAPMRPGDAYAASKLAAEQALPSLGGGMHTTVLRPPLVYGPGVKANFLALLSAVSRGVPLPLGRINNRRSLIYVDNLASAIIACVDSTAAAGRIYNVADDPSVSTPDLVRALAAASGISPRLFPVPPAALEACGALVGRKETVKRLTRSFEVDSSAIRSELGWRPPHSFETGIERTVRWYENASRKATYR